MAEIRSVGESEIDFPNKNTSHSHESVADGSVLETSSNATAVENLRRNYPTRDENVLKLIEISSTVISTKLPFLISGESGTGKEMFSKAIHIASGAGKGRFVVANSSSIPENFFEMELFPLMRAKNGYNFQPPEKENFTLMLNEIGDLSTALQFKLLRILEEQDGNKFRPQIGSAVDARIIACTNKNMQDEVNSKRFRNDLFFKLQVIHLTLPPLRQRISDIDLCSEIFLREFNSQFSKNTQLSQTAKQSLRAYTWPGNIRELKNVIQHSVLLASKDQISAEDLHLLHTNSRTEVAMEDALPHVTLRVLEQRLILQTLRRLSGNRTHTAKALGISLRALRYKLNELVECGYEVEGKNA